jgi:DNA-binding GntR family transcriptional regulator
MDDVTTTRLLPPARRTRAEELRAALAEEILRGVHAPGTPLDETALAQRFGMSRTPVREALGALAESGLVRKLAHRGTVVAHPLPDELTGMFETMGELEALCAGFAAERMTARERRALEAHHAAMLPLVRDGHATDYAAGNVVFHEMLYAGAHNACLRDLARRMRRQLAPFRRAQFDAPGRLAASQSEHDRVVQAVLRADRAQAIQAMRAHLGIVERAYDRVAPGAREMAGARLPA